MISKQAPPPNKEDFYQILRDAAVGRLVRKKLTSGNEVPVDRCTILASEVAAIDAMQ